MEEAIARARLIGISRTGNEIPVEVIVSRPCPHEEHDWACSVTVTGLDSRPRDIYGVDSLQALTLGLRFVAAHLSSFLETGGQLLDPEGREPFRLGAYFPAPASGAA